MSRDAIEIPGDWPKRDRHLHALAEKTGFRSINRLLAHVAYEISACKEPADFYRACAAFHDAKKNRPKK